MLAFKAIIVIILNSYIDIILGEGFWIFAHHVGQMTLAQFEFKILNFHELIMCFGTLQVSLHCFANFSLLWLRHRRILREIGSTRTRGILENGKLCNIISYNSK